VETEIKLDASPSFRLLDLTGVAPGVTSRKLATLRQGAIYLDTADLRLARNGLTLRHRTETARGKSQEGWTLKLPGGSDGVAMVRQEISWPGPPDAVPTEALGLVRAITRGAPLERIATVETMRARLQLRDSDDRDSDGRVIAEVDDDRVVVTGRDHRTSRFREIEVEATEGAHPEVLEAVRARLLQAGTKDGSRHPKVFRALGPGAEAPPDVVAPAIDRRATLRQVVAAAIAQGVVMLVRQDLGIRLGGDTEHVHKARVAARRLRSDVRTFRRVLDRDWCSRIREELRWLASALGEVRDADVLLGELRKQASGLPEVDAAAADALLAQLSQERKRANERLLAVLDSDRYIALLNELTAGASDPPLARSLAETDTAARTLFPRLLRKPWRRLRQTVLDLGDAPSDEDLHLVRKRAKAVRYTAEAAAPVIGKPAPSLAVAMENLQGTLGALHDAVVAEAWLRRQGIASEPPQALVAGQMIERERQRQAVQRAAWPRAWRQAARKRLRARMKS
jgi:CHAD domain-containing protein